MSGTPSCSVDPQSRQHGRPERGSSGGLTRAQHERALALCQKWDKNKDGAISSDELSQALKAVFTDVSDDDIRGLVAAVDLNKDGIIQYNEFLHWLQLPPEDKLCFEDNLRSFVLGTRSQKSSPHSPATPGSAPKELTRPPVTTDAVDEGKLQAFTHPLLSRFSVCDKFPTTVGAVSVKFTDSGHRGAAGFSSVSLRREVDGQRSIHATVPEFRGSGRHVSSGSELTLAVLEGLAKVYENILLEFCAALKPERPVELHLPKVPIVDYLARPIKHSPEVAWSAVALALARLGPGSQACLKNAWIIMQFPEGGGTLTSKVSAANVFQPQGHGLCRRRNGTYDWIRKDNDPDARLDRLQCFMQSQNAICAQAYQLTSKDGGQPQEVTLKHIGSMVKGTKVFLIEEAKLHPVAGQRTSLRTAQELGWPSEDVTAMEVAQALAAKGKRVAAVNAASAYHAGGGLSSGGRHALEEAWCSMSTLFRSLGAVQEKAHEQHSADYSTIEQHIPTLGCVLSPNVEVFRKMTSAGYGFLSEPVCLQAILSIAMFNRNPSVSDSPLDSPDDPAVYIAQVQSKLKAVIAAAVAVKAEVLVVPDVGCGVFRNDPVIVGGCFGAVLKECEGLVPHVVLTTSLNSFVTACKKAYQGQDPREGLEHEGTKSIEGNVVQVALVALAANPQSAPKPPCRYGRYCHIKSAQHLDRFSHPTDDDDGTESMNPDSMNPDVTVAVSAGDVATGSRPLCKYGKACYNKNPKHLQDFSHETSEGGSVPDECSPCRAGVNPDVAIPAGGGNPYPAAAALDVTSPTSKPVCRFGEACYSKDPKHLESFAHPWKDGMESAEARKARKDEQTAHELLTLAKGGDWARIRSKLRSQPELVNIRPETRVYGLIHHAAGQIRRNELAWFAEIGADFKMKTKDGESVEDVLMEALKNNPATTMYDKSRDEKLVQFVRRQMGSSVAAPAPASPAAPSLTDARPSGAKIRVRERVVRELNGEYAEVSAQHDGAPVYLKAPVESESGAYSWLSQPPKLYMYYNRDYNRGSWVIDDNLEDGRSLRNPMAYLRSTLCKGNPCQKAYGEEWSVWRSSILGGGYFTTDYLIKVEPA